MKIKLLFFVLIITFFNCNIFSQTYTTGATNWTNVWDNSSGKFDFTNGVGLFSFGSVTQGRIEGRFFTTDGSLTSTQRTVKPGQRIRIRIAGQDGGGRSGIVTDGIIGVSIKSGGGMFDGADLSARYDNNSILKIEFRGGDANARYTNGSGTSTSFMPNFTNFKSGTTYDIEVISDREFNLVIGSNRNNIQSFAGSGSVSPALIHIRNSGANMDGLFTLLEVSDIGVNLTSNDSENFTVTGIIANNESTLNTVTKNGTGTVNLTAANTYTGLTTINAGTLRLNRTGGGTLPATNNVTCAGGTLRVSTNQTLNNLTVPSGSTLTVDAGVTLTINGTFSGGGAINNSGTIQFAGSGGVAISGGTVEYTGSSAQTVGLGTYNNLTITNSAVKSLGGAVTVAGILNLNTSTITSIGANTLTLNGSLTGTGTLRGGSTSNLTIGGSGTLGTLLMDQSTLGSTNLLNNLTINRASQTLTLGNPLFLGGTLTPTAGTIASGVGNLVLVSTAAGNARIAEGPAAGGYITGSAVVSRFLPNNNPTLSGPAVYRRWRFFSLPVTGTSLRQFFTGKTNIGDDLTNDGDATQNNVGTLITGHRRSAAGAGFDYWTDLPTTASSSIRYYTPANGFSSASNTPDVQSTSPDQQGYLVFIRGDRRNTLTTSNTNVTTLPSLGALRTGNQTITIPSQTYAALGNPYVSPIDFVAVRANTGNAALIQDRFWMWDPHLATAGGWRLVKQVSGNWRAVPTPFGDGDPADEGNVQHIQPGQAVLVEPTAAGTLLIEENDKSANTGNTFIRPFETTASDAGLLEVNLSQADNGKFNLADGILATVAGNLSESINDADDVLKVGNTFSALGLALVRQNSRLATEGRPASLATDTLFLQTTGLAANQLYRFSVNATGAALANKTIQLIDQFANTTINLPVGAITQVEFTPTTDLNSTANNRFLIVLNNNNTLPVSFTRIAAREQQGNVAVEWTVAAETGVKHYAIEHSTNGRDFGKAGLVRARNNGAATYSFIHQQPGIGNHYYRLRSEDADGKSQLTQVVKVTLGSSQKGFGVYPTLVSGNRFTVELNGLSKGRYTLQVNDMAGKMLMNTAIQHEGGSAAQNLQLPAGLAAGTYLIRLQGEGSSYSQKIVKE